MQNSNDSKADNSDVLLTGNSTEDSSRFLRRELEQVNQSLFEEADRRKKTEFFLQIERKRLETILQIVEDGIICTDEFGLITTINSAAENLTGWFAKEAIGKPVEKVFQFINDSTREKGGNIVKNVLETGDETELKNILLISKDGKECPVEVFIAPVSEIKEETDGAVLAIRDYSNVTNRAKSSEIINMQNQIHGKFTRRHFDKETIKSKEDFYIPFAFVMADVKGIGLNTFGYKYSELLLKKVSNILNNECRPGDIVIRIGNGKFVILMPFHDAKYSNILISRLNKTIAEENIKNIVFSLSTEISVKDDIYDNLDDVLKKLQDEIYKNKISESLSSRNKIIFIMMNTLFGIIETEKTHSQMVSGNSVAIAKKMDLSEDMINQIKLAGFVHDIGKIGIDENILTSKGKLNNKDWETIRRHPEIGYRILRPSNVFSEIANIVLDHHEKWDGKGYPRGLRGEEISLQARIIAVADTYDGIITKREYKKEMRDEEVISEMRSCAGTQLDPEIVKVFVEEVLGK